jgi:CPA2 family monovalent cation:H+ antiporter-2
MDDCQLILDKGIIANDQYALILAVALGSILLSPLLIHFTPRLVSLSNHLPGVHIKESMEVGAEPTPSIDVDHVILCGFGRVGAVLGDVLAEQDYPFTVIEINSITTRELRERGILAFYGDAGSEDILVRAGIRRASVLVVTVSDLLASRAAIRCTRLLNPNITIITQAVSRDEVRVLHEAGDNEIIQPEFEAGLECVGYMLRTLGMHDDSVASIVDTRRQSLYDSDTPERHTTLTPTR